MTRRWVMLILLLGLILSDQNILPPLTLRAEDLPDLTPSSLSLNPSQPKVGGDLTLSFVVKNIGRAASGECYGALFVGDSLQAAVTIPCISPGSSGVATVVWVPPIQGVYRITFVVDYWESISDSNLNNNELVVEVTVTQAGSTTLSIISGPSVAEAAQTSATIYWETSVSSYGWVEYDNIAGLYRYKETDDLLSWTHRIELADLKPSATYHFTVYSRGASGESVTSKEAVFETLPDLDELNPRVTFLNPSLCEGVATISAEAFDDRGVERVELIIDGVNVFTDYSTPYRFSFDSSKYVNGAHRIILKAFDTSGRSTTEYADIDVWNFNDSTEPIVVLTTPKVGDTVTGKIKVAAALSDDVGLVKAIFLVNGTTEAYAGLPDRPKSTSLTFEWETRYLPNGNYRLAVEARDKSNKQGLAICDVAVYNPPNTFPPHLKVSHAVTRHENYFEVSITAENVGDTAAEDVIITDYLTAFQPLERSDPSADYQIRYGTFKNQGECRIVSKVPIPGKKSVTYTFEAVPILFPYISSSNPYTPEIGETTLMEYKESNGSEYSEECHSAAMTTTGGEPVTTAYFSAINSADYLIITNPSHLLNYNQRSEVDALLTTMANLARLKMGALGYVVYPYHTNQAIKSLIAYGGPWSNCMKNGWASNGFLLIVGEEEIIPAWDRTIGTFWTTGGTWTYRVNADYPYASTYGDETVPELSIGRIIGDTAAKLRLLIQTSINVYLKKPGYTFDRSKALLASGDPRGMDFLGAVSEASKILSKQNPGIAITKLDMPPLTQYTTYPNGTHVVDKALTNALVNSTFFVATPEQDVIFLAGHGGPYTWDELRYENVMKTVDPFGSTSPFIFASSCSTGVYAGRWYINEEGITVYDPQVTGIAEAFLEKGAAVYLGSLHSAGWAPYSNKFFETWDLDDSVASTVREMKRSLGDDDRDVMWKGLYQVYGDAKYGAVGYPTTKVGFLTTSSTRGTLSAINVEVPYYQVSRIDGGDRVDVPGGYSYLESGTPQVPCYKVFYDYSAGYQIQDVVLSFRSKPSAISGLNIPTENIIIPATGDQVLANSTYDGGWWPPKDYDWTMIQNPEGTTLAITIYPFYYNAETTEARFYKSYRFDVNYTISRVEISGATTDKSVYGVDEPVTIDVEVSNVGDEGVNVVVNSVITREGGDEAVSRLPLRILKDLSGRASYSTHWDSTGFDPGYYSVVTELKDAKGNLLDKEIEGFRIGEPSGELTSLKLDPKEFKIGERVDVKIVFQNTGSVNLTGGTVTRIYNSRGDIINEFSHSFTELPPHKTVEYIDTWDTSSIGVDSYKVAGFAQYDGATTPPTIRMAGVDAIPPSITPVAWAQVLKENASLNVEVLDQNEVTSVEFSISDVGEEAPIETNQALKLSDDVWRIAFDTTKAEDGAYSLTIKASDYFNNIGIRTMPIIIRNQPSLDITTQQANAPLKIDGVDHRTDQKGTLSVTLPTGKHTIEVQTQIETEASRALFTEWGDQAASSLRTITLDEDLSLLAKYKKQHLLTVTSPTGDPRGSGWYDDGATASFSVTSPTGFIIQKEFVGWSGDSNSTSANAETIVDGPKTVMANWKTDYTQLYALIGLSVAIVATLGIILKRRH